MKCVDCAYYYWDVDEFGNTIDLPYCHYDSEDDAPCEYDNDNEDEDY